MIFEDVSQRRWKKIVYVSLGIAVILGTLFLVAIAFLFVSTPQASSVPDIWDGISQEGEPARWVSFQIMNEYVTETSVHTSRKNPNQKNIDTRIRKLKSLPLLSGPFMHTALITQSDIGTLQDLEMHAKKLDIAFPDWYTFSGSTCSVAENIRWDILEVFRKTDVPVIPRFSVDTPASFFRLIQNKSQAACLIEKLGWNIKNRSAKGIHIDIGNVPTSQRDAYTLWILSLAEYFHRERLSVVVSVPLGQGGFDYGNIGAIADMVMIRGYSEHFSVWKPGPLVGIDWFGQQLDLITRKIPPKKTIISLWSYGFDWDLTAKIPPETLGFHTTVRLADSKKSDIQWDRSSSNYTFTYRDSDGNNHEVWFLDALSTWNQYIQVRQLSLAGISLMHTSDEDASAWAFMSSGALVSFDPESLSLLPNSPATITNGTGKFFRASYLGREGERGLSLSGKAIVDSKYIQVPQSPTILRFSPGKAKTIALIFYGGPGEHTDHILDTLKKHQVRSTFFPVNQQMEGYAHVIGRIYAEGHLLGNSLSQKGIDQAMEKSESTIRAISGHRTLLVHTPRDTDIRKLASFPGYTFMTPDIDSGDLNNPGTERIIHSIVSQLQNKESNIVALHDGGGDRMQTIKALEKIIPSLQKEGYEFVTVNAISGMPREVFMPAIAFEKYYQSAWENFLYGLRIGLLSFLAALFIVTTVISLLRIVFLTLYIHQFNRSGKKHFSRKFLAMPPVTVLVPAYNEEKVIERTILGLLTSDYPHFEILVIDDGSCDRTAEYTKALAQRYSNVRLISKKNEGKALALNLGFREATYEYIITVDADTIVLPKTLYHLMEPFVDSAVDAVCGNIWVGNVKNVLTAFQEVEYVTGQNFDRRAFDVLNCIGVVPGATGAWKKWKVLDIGGYSNDTLVEDADLTLTLLKNGGRIVYAPLAKSVTEVPEMVRPLYKQRFRWSYGTFQCFWKHRSTFGKGAIGIIALPNMLLFQVIFPILFPIGDLILIIALFCGNIGPILSAYALFFLMDAFVSGTAYRLDRKSIANIWVILIQRFFYRQFIYFVTFASILAAFKWGHHGWNKLERKGTVQITETV